jgi:cobalt-zinc-cadmium efflux system membrane fusion protein
LLNSAALSLTLLIACGPAFGQASTVPVSDAQSKQLGISTGKATAVEAVGLIDLTARVVRAPGGVATVSAPFGGAVMVIHVLPGQQVRAGDPVATLASREYAAGRSSLEQSRSEAEAATRALKRQRQLVQEGLATRLSLDEADARDRSARAAVKEYESLVGQARPGAAGGYILRAASAGRVDKIALRVGETASPNAVVASILTSNKLHAEISLPTRMIGQVKVGDVVEFASGGSGRILSIGQSINPATRSVVATADISDDAHLIDGQLVRVRVVQPASTSLVQVPAAAIVRLNGGDHVFLKTDRGFAPVPVVVVGKTADAATVSGGLRAETQVAVHGLTELKAMALQVPR